jgi:hypothetical protein
MNPADRIEKSIERLHITTRAETDKRILNDAFTALEKSTRGRAPHIEHIPRRRTLKIRIAELAAVAAVVLLVFALFFGIPPKRAAGLGGIYKALGEVRNVCVATFSPSANEPLQYEWLSQNLNVEMSRLGEQFVLVDIPNKVRITRSLSSDSIRTEAISKEMLAGAEKTIHQTFGLLPFASYRDVPKNAQWNRVDDMRVTAIVPGTKVYELIWLQKSTTSGLIGFRMWRVFVDPRTSLPIRAEHYFKLENEEDYKFEKYEVITYPSEDEIQMDIRKTFGPAAGRPDEPGYIATPGDRPR